ncbi:MAG: hypothetical protein IKH81_01550 [Clostridia bacterium]|nr:hypothetical protein [Clostridia bacterium]MBR6965757.1 hypothetical protein [Clostridia bacterium]
MKRITVIFVVLMVLMAAICANADGYWYDGREVWRLDEYGNPIPHSSVTFNNYLADHNFPLSVLQDVSDISSAYNGTWVGCLGITGSKGANLRTYPNAKGTYVFDWWSAHGFTRPSYEDPSIVRKLHSNVTVYVYFSCYSNGGLWYFVTTNDRTCGFLHSNNLALIPE